MPKRKHNISVKILVKKKNCAKEKNKVKNLFPKQYLNYKKLTMPVTPTQPRPGGVPPQSARDKQRRMQQDDKG